MRLFSVSFEHENAVLWPDKTGYTLTNAVHITLSENWQLSRLSLKDLLVAVID